ncbi:MAG: hypothetical protein ACI9H6_000798, partial [Patiriisocius sp.]
SDSDDNGSWDGTHPLYISAGGNYATFENQVRANSFCDRAGNNCSTPAGIRSSLSPAAETDPQVGLLDGGKWCRSNNAGTAIWCGEDKPLTTCTKRSVTRDNPTFSRTTAFCKADEVVTGGSCNTNGTYHPPNFPIKPSDPNFPSSGPNRLGWQCATAGSDSGHTSVHVMCCK